MPGQCTHLDAITTTKASGQGCVECLETGGHWVHLRRCVSCGHVGCCDSSPGHHATGHYETTAHPLMQSFEPGEEWFWCYPDELLFEIEAKRPSPAHD
jgi:uncharacterized UBP type Zn finger protein